MTLSVSSFTMKGGGGGWHSLEFLVGMCCQVLLFLTLFQTKQCPFPLQFSDLAPVVRKLDSAIHWINYYPLDSAIGCRNTYPLDSDLSGVQRYPAFEQPGPDL